MLNFTLRSAALALVLAVPLAAEAREMRVSSFEPAQGFYSSKVLQAWIDQVNPQLTGGTSFRLYPGSILGAPPAQAELVKAGVADVALVVPTYTPGLFPMSGVVEVPGLVETSAEGTAILNALADDGALEAEYADYKVLAVFTTPGYRFLMSGEGVATPADLGGLKLRTPSPFGSELLAMLGASGVAIPAPQVYENLERGVVSGAVWVMDAYRTFRLDEVAPAITSLRFTASPMAILMNKAAWDSLPEADRAALEAATGRVMAEWIAGVVDATDAEIEASFRAAGKVKFIDLDAAAVAEWQAVLAPAAEAWVAGQADPAAAQGALDTARAVAGN
ncbi:TRAP transporter substrate-binding protein [Frigidibacter sp.]|uniref:TRAP transporter substrate-binding protein n=1 Tax=Frigidibacter sp. TaxID=2586418 RepID=UPI002736A91D|nr:TRAP transporter substrate-binding protein [Frigidibacter sp.]MDP3339218.1 TRAP transporter substrate-binding protein [Frigidibacter sp.]